MYVKYNLLPFLCTVYGSCQDFEWYWSHVLKKLTRSLLLHLCKMKGVLQNLSLIPTTPSQSLVMLLFFTINEIKIYPRWVQNKLLLQSLKSLLATDPSCSGEETFSFIFVKAFNKYFKFYLKIFNGGRAVLETLD